MVQESRTAQADSSDRHPDNMETGDCEPRSEHTRLGRVAPSRQSSADASSAVLTVRPRMPELDALRAIAALVVVLHHLTTLPAPTDLLTHALAPVFHFGWLGVDLFFVLSGFLITGILLDSRSDPRFYQRFYVRRAFRILPLYFVSLAGVVCLLFAWSTPASVRTIVFSLMFLANAGQLCGFALPGPLVVYWSLAVEEHFYAIWPVTVRNVRRRSLFWICLVLVIVSPLARYLVVRTSSIDVYFLTPFRLDGLCIGAALAAFVRLQPSLKLALCLSGLLISLGLLTAGVLGALGVHDRTNPLGAALVYTFASLLIGGAFLLLLIAFRGTTRRSGPLRPLGFIGDVSYSLYLNHLVVLYAYDRWIVRDPQSALHGIMRIGAVLAGAILLAVVTREWIELPLQRVRDRVLSYVERVRSR